MPEEVSVGVVIFRKENSERKYLLIKYTSGHWEFSRGGIEEGEPEIETAKREAAEEVGITDLEFVDNFREKSFWSYKKDEQLINKKVTFYLAKTRTKEVKLSYEHTDHRWLEFKDALDQLTFRDAKEILKKAESLLNKK